MKTVYKFIILLIPIFLLHSCVKEQFPASNMTGLWKQVSVTEDGAEMNLTPEQKSCKLLIDANGVYRCYQQAFSSYNKGNGPTAFYGTWSILDDTWVNFSTDKWEIIATLSADSAKVNLDHKKFVRAPGDTIIIVDTLKSVQKQWAKYHIQSRFTILKLTDTEMEIRLKTYVGEKKYALLFAPDPADFVELNVAAGKINYSPKLVTDANYWIIQKELRTQKTYIYKFQKQSN
jgi:hypothetical protein